MAGQRQVQRQNGVALWRQIADRVRTSIDNGEYDHSGMVPPELVLAEQFGVNRHTVRSALAALGQEGIVRAVQGRGTLIERRQRLNFPISKRTRFTAGVGGQGRELQGLLLSFDSEPASETIATHLCLATGTPVIKLEALRKVDGVPVSRSTSWFPGDRFAGIAEAYRRSESITKAFAELGLADYIRTSTEISATHAEPSEITDLELSPGAIVLVTKALNTDLDGVPVQYAITRFPADRVHFTIEN